MQHHFGVDWQEEGVMILMVNALINYDFSNFFIHESLRTLIGITVFGLILLWSLFVIVILIYAEKVNVMISSYHIDISFLF